jgi:hypothetical protein
VHYKFIAFTANQEKEDLIIPPFAELIRKIKVLNYNKMLSIRSRIPKAKKAGSLQPVIPLIPLKTLPSEVDKGNYISFMLNTTVGGEGDSPKYRKKVRKFEEGTPQEWIDTLRDLNEIWTQNAIAGGQDRVATVRAIIAGESAVAFDAALEDARRNEAGVDLNITTAHVETALQAVSTDVFPHRALEIQKLWMNRRMFKPTELTTRQTAAAINRLNNSLPMFPAGTEASKFSPTEIIGLLEWSLPPAWRAKFDLDGYVPTLWAKARLIEACEAIERNEENSKENNKSDDPHNKKNKIGKSKRHGKKSGTRTSAGADAKHYCTKHRHNPSHDMADCYTLKNRASKAGVGNKTPKGKQFSNKEFRRELNMMAKKSSKKQVLDLYASAIKHEKAKLLKKQASKRTREPEDEEESDSEHSAFEMSLAPAPLKSAVKRNKKIKAAVFNDEEAAYQKKVK